MQTIYEFFKERLELQEKCCQLHMIAWDKVENASQKELHDFTQLLTKRAINDFYSWIITSKWPEKLYVDINESIVHFCDFHKSQKEKKVIYDSKDIESHFLDDEYYFNATKYSKGPILSVSAAGDFFSINYDVFSSLTNLSIEIGIVPSDPHFISIYFDNNEYNAWSDKPRGWNQCIFRDAIYDLLNKTFKGKVIGAGSTRTNALEFYTSEWVPFEE